MSKYVILCNSFFNINAFTSQFCNKRFVKFKYFYLLIVYVHIKGEIRCVVDPDKIENKIEEMNLTPIKTTDRSIDTYFGEELFLRGTHLRTRNAYLSKPKLNYKILHIKLPDQCNLPMNYRTGYIVEVNDVPNTQNILKNLGYEQFFQLKWKGKEYKIKDTKFELAYINSWDWIIEIETVTKEKPEKCFKKLCSVLSIFDIDKNKLIKEETATYVYKTLKS